MSSSICIPNMTLLACKVVEKSLTKKCNGITEGRTDRRTDRMTDRCKPVYPPLFQSRGIIIITKGHKTKTNVEGVTVHNQSLVILLFVPSFVKLSQMVSKISMPEIKTGNNTAKTVSGVTSFNLCKMAGHALHLYQVS